MAASSASAWVSGSRSKALGVARSWLFRAGRWPARHLFAGTIAQTLSSHRGRSCTANAKRTEAAETEGPSGIDARPSWVKPASRLHVTRAEQDLPGKLKRFDVPTALGHAVRDLRRKSGGERVAPDLDVRSQSCSGPVRWNLGDLLRRSRGSFPWQETLLTRMAFWLNAYTLLDRFYTVLRCDWAERARVFHTSWCHDHRHSATLQHLLRILSLRVLASAEARAWEYLLFGQSSAW